MEESIQIFLSKMKLKSEKIDLLLVDNYFDNDKKQHSFTFNYLVIVNKEIKKEKNWFNLDTALKEVNIETDSVLLIKNFISQKKLEENKDLPEKYQRVLADYQNLIKKNNQERQEFIKFALVDFLEELLPIYDHLKLSLVSLPKEEESNAWVLGVKHVLRQFKELLKVKGVEEIKTVNQPFDHNLMEAIDGEGDLVVKEVSPGYILNNRLLKPAKVIVGKNKKK